MCSPAGGVRVSLDSHEPNVVKKLHGSSQVAPKTLTDKEATKIISNPLAVPLKVPGMG